MKALSAFKSDVRLFLFILNLTVIYIQKPQLLKGLHTFSVQVQVAVVSSAAVHNCLHSIKVD